MALELAGGAIVGELLKEVLDAGQKASGFQPFLARLESTLRSLIPRIDQISRLNHQLNLQQSEMEELVSVINNGKALVVKCSKISSINFIRKVQYSKELLDLDNTLLRYFVTILPLDHFKDTKEILLVVKELQMKIVGGYNNNYKHQLSESAGEGSSSTGGVLQEATTNSASLTANSNRVDEDDDPDVYITPVAVSDGTASLPARPKTVTIQRTSDNGNLLNGEVKRGSESMLVVANPQESESEEKPQKSLNEKQKENQDLLIKCITQDLGFSGGKPVAACLIYKCLLHWRSFEVEQASVEQTSVFDRIIQTIAAAIEVRDNNDVLLYWLSNTSTLLLLLQQTLKASGADNSTPQRRRTSSPSLFRRMSQGLGASPQSVGFSFHNLGGIDDLRQVEAEYPALLFKQLTDFLKKIYGMIRDNLKKEISPLLALCIQVHPQAKFFNLSLTTHASTSRRH